MSSTLQLLPFPRDVQLHSTLQTFQHPHFEEQVALSWVEHNTHPKMEGSIIREADTCVCPGSQNSSE
jgi:hypothetical protein